MRNITWSDLTIQDLTKSYKDWAWLLGNVHIKPLMITKFGDLFYQTVNGEVYFLDTIEGTDSYICSSNEEFVKFINEKENIEHYLFSNLVYDLINQGKVPAAHQCYSYKVLPVLGGQIGIENVEIMDAVVSISITGQVHRQVRDLPEGTVIKGFKLS